MPHQFYTCPGIQKDICLVVLLAFIPRRYAVSSVTLKGCVCTLWHAHAQVVLHPQFLLDTSTHLHWDWVFLLLIQLLTRKLLSLCVECVFRCQYHTNTIPVHSYFPNEGLGEAHTRRRLALDPVVGQDESIVPMLDHAHCHTCCEVPNEILEVAQHGVSD